MKVTILGCGGSGGVPLMGPNWGDCNPENPKNRRRRVSIALRQRDTTILVDTSPDLRAQCLDAGISQVSAILYTHDHADHTQGIDDARFLKKPAGQATIPAYGTRETLATLTARFAYIFQQNTEGSGHLYKPFLRPIEVTAPFEIGEYWARDRQIDVVGVRGAGVIDIGEGKWGRVPSGAAIASALASKVAGFPNPAGATLVTDAKTVAVHCIEPAPEVEEEAAGAAEPEVIGRKAEDEEEGAKEK